MLTLLLLGQTPSPDAVLKRFDQFLANSGALAVTVKTNVNGTALGTATVRIDRPLRFSVTLTSSHGAESVVMNETGALEVSHGTEIYASHPAIGRLYIPDFQVTEGLRYSIPSVLVRGSAQGFFPKESNPKVTPKVMVNGVATDQISAKVEGAGGSNEVRANFDATGRLLKFYTKSVSPQGTMVIDQDLSNYAVRQKFTAAQFSTRLPVGYSPFALDRADSGVPQGEPLPNVELKAAASGQAASLKNLISGKNALVVVADADFHANADLFKSIASISKKIPDFRLIVISAKGDAASAKKIGVPNVYFDPTGAQLAKLQAPGVPTMYLVDKKGSLAQMFFGFDGEWEGLDAAIARLKKAG